MDADLDTLATALYVTLYVTIDDLLKTAPHLAPWRPTVGITPKLSDAELVTLAVMQALLGFTSEARWLRHAHAHLRHLFPTYQSSPATTNACAPPPTCCAGLSGSWPATPRCGPTTCGSVTPPQWNAAAPPRPSVACELAGWAQDGSCASHSRSCWGLRLHLVCTLHGLPVAFALTGAKADERQTLLGMLAADPSLLAGRDTQTSSPTRTPSLGQFETELAERGVRLLRPAARVSVHVPVRTCCTCSNRYGRSSSRSTTRSRRSWTWNATTATPPRAWPCAYSNASSRCRR